MGWDRARRGRERQGQVGPRVTPPASGPQQVDSTQREAHGHLQAGLLPGLRPRGKRLSHVRSRRSGV